MQTTRRRLWGRMPRDHLHSIDITTQHINDQDIENKYSKEVMANSDTEDKVDVSDFRSHYLWMVEATSMSSWFAIANVNAH
jgi:GTP-sensing pleiotropic transcriptional regulator CodY